MAKSCHPDAGKTSVCLIRARPAKTPQEQMLQHAALRSQIREVFGRAAAEEHGSLLLDIVTRYGFAGDFFGFHSPRCADAL